MEALPANLARQGSSATRARPTTSPAPDIQPSASFRSDERIGRVSAPILALHGERERVGPLSVRERLFALANEPKRMVRFPRGDHVNLDEHGAAKVVTEFLA